MKKNSKKETKEKSTMFNNVVFTLRAFEVKEFEKVDIIKCALYNGKDSDGDYNESIYLDVVVTGKTDAEYNGDFGKKGALIDVAGFLAMSVTETKGKTYRNLRVVASKVRDHSDEVAENEDTKELPF